MFFYLTHYRRTRKDGQVCIMRQNLVHQNVFNFLLRQIDKAMPAFRKRRAHNEHILYHILCVLKYGIPWRATGSSEGTYAWQTVYRRYSDLVKNEIFSKIWNKVTVRYAKNSTERDREHFRDIYVDTTFIKNVGGSDTLGKNPTDRGRLATKVSVVCDKDKTVIGYVASPCESDVKLVEPTLDSIPFDLRKLRNRRATYLIADKAYASYDLSHRMNKRKLRLITDRKKRQRHTNHVCARKTASTKLKTRYIVEHVFGMMKRFKRVPRREDRKITAYMTFFLLGSIIRTLTRFPDNIF